MQNTTINGRHASPKTAHFARIAEDARRQLIDVDVLIIRLETQAGFFDGTRLPHDLSNRLDQARRKRRELRDRMDRALFNAGRL